MLPLGTTAPDFRLPDTTGKMVSLLQKEGALDEAALRDLETVMRDSSICGLGQAAPNPVNHLLVHFREDI